MTSNLRLRRRFQSASRPLAMEVLESRSLLAIDLISVDLPSAKSNGPSTSFNTPSLSSDGRYVAFASDATNLVVNDYNRLRDVFVRDTTSNTTQLISETSAGFSANGNSDEVSLTPNGRYAVFSSAATNLTAEASPGVFVRDLQTDTLVFVANGYSPEISDDGRYVVFMAGDGTIAGDNNQSDDVFLWDRVTDLITRMSVAANGTQTFNASVTGNPSISGDGRFVAFNSDASNLVVSDGNAAQDVFVKTISTGAIVRVSQGTFGDQGNSGSYAPQISTTGQYVAFISNASNFVANDSNNADVYVKNVTTGSLVRGSADVNGVASNGTVYSRPVISTDGRYVTFETNANNLVSIDTNGVNDAFLKDLTFGTVTLLSTSSTNVQGDDGSFNPTSTSTGRFTAFYSYATNLVTGDTNGFPDVFWKDRQTNQVKLVSSNFEPTHGFSGNNNSFGPGAISTTGRYVAFTSAASDLVASDANGSEADVFVRDTLTGVTTLVSRDSNGVQGNADSYWASLSGDGRYLTFTSDATNLVANDTNNRPDIFRKDLTTGTVLRVTVTALGLQSDGNSDQSMVSDDGRYVVFYSDSSNLISGDSNVTPAVYRKDMQSGVIQRASANSSGQAAIGASDVPSLSADGRYVAFQSNASNLVANDTNGFADVFVKDMQLGTVRLASMTAAGVQGNGASLAPRISPNGLYVTFQSVASNLVAGDTNLVSDSFVTNLTSLAVTRISVNAAGVQGNQASTTAVISNDGRFASFLSNATNLTTGNSNTFTDVFLKDLQLGTVTLLSVSDSNLTSDGSSDRVSMTRDGVYVTFASLAEDLTPYDGQGYSDVFRADGVTASLSLQLSSSSVPESTNTVAATVSRTGSTAAALVVNLSSSATSSATVPATVTILAGQTQATFNITVVGPPSALITAAATGLGTVSQTLTIGAVNHAPSFSLTGNPPVAGNTGGTQTVDGFAFNISPGPASEAGQTVTFTVTVVSVTGNLTFTTPPAITVISSSNGRLTYAATPGTSGTATVSVTAFDNGGTQNGGDNSSNPQTFTINVIAGNPAIPTVSGAPGNQTLHVNETTGPLAFTVGDDGPPGNLVVTATSSLPGLIPNGNITFGGAGTANRTIQVTPVLNSTGGPAVITVSVRDAEFNSTTFQFSVTVIPFLYADIYADGTVDSQDVGFIVYYFAVYGPGAVSRLPQGPPQRADVNRDGLFDAQDVLLVIYEFNGVSGGEGESAAGAVAADSAPADAASANDLALLQMLGVELNRKKK